MRQTERAVLYKQIRYKSYESFNKFYNTNPIMKDDVDEETKKARLAIVDATTEVIKTALGLLGMKLLKVCNL